MTQEWYTKKMNENVETIYFSTNEKYKYLSSSSIKALTKMKKQEFINYMKKIAYIDGMIEERMDDYLWNIHDVYGG
jgi:phosphopantetheine adenylyltransferase